MEELIAPVIGFLAGLWLSSSGVGSRPVGMALGAVIAVCAGLVGTVITGEYRESWIFLLTDVSTAASGVAVAMLIG